MNALIEAIDALLDFIGDRTYLNPEQRERFRELDREVYVQAHCAELAGAFPKMEALERPLSADNLPPVQFLGETRLPYDAAPDGIDIYPGPNGWWEALTNLRALAETVEKRKAKPEGKTRRPGRPTRDETPKGILVVTALVKHHKYQQGGSIENHEPAVVAKLAKDYDGLSESAVSRFFKKKFPGAGHKGYVAACNTGKIGSLLAIWQGDTPSGMHDLNEEDYGRSRY